MSSRDRRNSIKALFGETAPRDLETKSTVAGPAAQPPGLAEDEQAPFSAPQAPPRPASGAVKAMGLSLGEIAREAGEARVLRQALEESERVVDLDTGLIHASFVSDRLSQSGYNDPDFAGLVESIRDNGQQVPILVRPHPDRAGRYQVAYGHRRLQAAASLGIPVKAIVRPLDDERLVLAQGKENAERRNLSFAERAIFARALVTRGFDRKLVGAALKVDKSELSRLLQVTDAIPDRIFRAVGPAPKAGRDRWMALASFFVNDAAIVRADMETRLEVFSAANTDTRFEMLFKRMARRPPPAKAQDLKGPDGKVFARIDRAGKTPRIAFSLGADPAFVEEIAARLEEDYARFVKARGD